ncbi:beta-glucosidase [Methylopila sp. Yamaguchi]|uniref:beta-glucosidase n=1 Tax=Methylopila sp. Yamaguchi TaxID=1437817 RepID=UPI000CC68DF4|nr:beta-glucosidase [Methylopila sp. Yamaguchi]GBD49479.1 hypothetical protein METY_2692 [Methylopila sp. Yamaguchi]
MRCVIIDAPPASAGLQSFFVAGFECSSHRRADGVRLDLIAATGHDELAARDFERLAALGVTTVRDGMRWHLIEKGPGFYDWSSVRPMLRAAKEARVQVIWDLCHYGYPDKLDIWSPAFVERFARFAREAARFVRSESDDVPYYCPINEMSYWAWAGGDMRQFNPMTKGRGPELKRQLARAAIAAIEAVRSVDPRARFLTAEPTIHVAPAKASASAKAAAEGYRLAQFEATDMVAGRLHPELGGSPDKLDIVGVNFYPQNQWVLDGGTIPMGHHDYRPFREMLAETAARYGRPVLISETGAEGTGRAAWLHYVCDEVAAAREAGVQVEGITLYPILDYPGWDNGRVCEVGLFTTPNSDGERAVFKPLAEELARRLAQFEPGVRWALPDRVVPIRRGAAS